jgi:two-component system response regulator AtoC
MHINSKFIFATNKPLSQMVENESFMPDLYDRFSQPKIEIPPLRKRKNDIGVLAGHFISKYDSAHQQDPYIDPIKVSEECIQYLKDYNWPGNVRELERTIKMIVLMRQASQDISEIIPSDLPAEITDRNKIPTKGIASPESLPGNQKLTDDQIQYWMKELNGNKTHVAKKLGVSYNTILRRCKQLGI